MDYHNAVPAGNSNNSLNNKTKLPIFHSSGWTLENVLEEINLKHELYEYFNDNGIDCECLLHMSDRHIDELMPIFGIRIKILFEHRLKKWRKKFEMQEKDTVSMEIFQKKCDQAEECQLLSIQDKSGSLTHYHIPKTNYVNNLPNRLMEVMKSSLDTVLKECKAIHSHETNQKIKNDIQGNSNEFKIMEQEESFINIELVNVSNEMEPQMINDNVTAKNESEKMIFKNETEKFDFLKTLKPSYQIVNNHRLEPSAMYNRKRKWGLETEVKEILLMYKAGNTILETYQGLGSMTPEMRTELVHMVVDHFVVNHEYLSVIECRKLAEEIVVLFPSESLDTYFYKEYKICTPRGKLWDRYQNRRQKHKKILNSLLLSPQSSCEYTKPDREDMEILCGELKFIEDDKRLLRKWNKTFHYRRYQLQSEYFDNWKIYFDEYPFCKQPNYSQFIDADLDVLYPNLKFNEDLWHAFIRSFKTLYWNRISHGKSRELFDDLLATKDIQEKMDYFEVKIIELLHAILNSSQDVIEEAQRQFTIEVSDLGELKKVVIERKKFCFDRSIQCKPYIAVVGQNQSYEHYSVVIDSTGFSCDSYQEAIMLCFKLYLFFDLSFTKETRNTWIFIQKVFFQ